MAAAVNTLDSSVSIPSNVSNGKEKVVRMCVLGATGVGKSTFCNFICNQQEFKTQDGLNSCTKQSKSYRFDYNINEQQIKFEITDTPGWFDIKNRCPPPAVMIEKIKECIKISENGITAYFIVVPYERFHMDVEQSIYFMRDCFDTSQLRHVWMIFTKCKKIKNVQQILDAFEQQKNAGEEAAALVYNYSQTINEQCFVTECEYSDVNQLQLLRNDILSKMNNLYNELGTAPEGVFQIVQRNYQRQLETIKTAERKKYNKRIMMMGMTGIGFAGIVAVKGYIKYQSLFSNNIRLQKKYDSSVRNADALKQQYESVVTDSNALKQDISSLKDSQIWYETASGVAEVCVGAACFLFEPVTSTLAISDGMRRLIGVDHEAKKNA